MTAARVAVLGGGVGGLSAAHELVERGFSVDVYERRPIAAAGGKARSIKVPNSATGGRRPLPGEHGFRFFPAFYKHLPDTMKRIPLEGRDDSVFSNLVPTTEGEFAGANFTISVPASLPDTFDEIAKALMSAFESVQTEVPPHEVAFFVHRLLILLTTGDRRRFAELENTDWLDFVDADRHSKAYNKYLADGMTRSLVAARANEISTRTCGLTLLQLLGCFQPGVSFDRLLNGPTNDVWIDPWVAYLRGEGVRFHDRTEVRAINCAGSFITGIGVIGPLGPSTVTADYYVASVPVERMVELLTPALIAAAPSLSRLPRLETRWMNGIQFYLDRPLPLVRGHIIYQDSPFSLTSVSQAQFWTDFDFTTVGDGSVRDILSVDISDWTTEGLLFGKPAMELTPTQIRDEVIAQLEDALNENEVRFPRDAVITHFLDDDIVQPNPGELTNAEPLLINTAGSWFNRPDATTEVDNLFLAADYVRTHTDLATMEGANEAARRAVNGILAMEQSKGRMADQADCVIWDLDEPPVLKPLRDLDDSLFNAGLPHPKALIPDALEEEVAKGLLALTSLFRGIF
jgi:uncharacterized protein with NAD-binding domain and iron-sulfur cluster